MALERKSHDGETSAAAVMCVAGCGFYGSASTNDMCSQCHREYSGASDEVLKALAAKRPDMATWIDPLTTLMPNPYLANQWMLTTTDAEERAANREMMKGFPRQRRKKMPTLRSGVGSTTFPAERKKKKKKKTPKPSAGVGSTSAEPAAAEQPEPAATASRCAACQRKVGLTGFRCRCGDTFCGTHRYAEKHCCSFDYKSAGKEQIAKQNPLVVADKLGTRI